MQNGFSNGVVEPPCSLGLYFNTRKITTLLILIAIFFFAASFSVVQEDKQRSNDIDYFA